ncbi:sugar nucleotide-binding protein [Bifidobacterium porcinum]|uniref:sugar nucleotide-binding protein n=1 Tax=Bifidobacterium porcinum TaxID=212365 RepID=UPI0023A93B5D|nr:sugar nucleotide-binding protein [Bifidobacterium porcinum]
MATNSPGTCAEHGITLVHISSDYVFDGTRELHDEEGALLAPLRCTDSPRQPVTWPWQSARGTTSCARAGS